MTALRLIIFDVDGTLVDSQTEIFSAMELAHQALSLGLPEPEAIRSIVGLSLPEGFARLHPDLDDRLYEELSHAYRQAYFTLRTAPEAVEASFYPGMRALLDALRGEPHTLLAVATGKSRRGLDRLIRHHGLDGYFFSTQVSDNHPSKPNPAMIMAAMDECGVQPDETVMIGDTTYDIDMARAAGVRSIGVAWGYHETHHLDADAIAHSAADLTELLRTETLR